MRGKRHERVKWTRTARAAKRKSEQRGRSSWRERCHMFLPVAQGRTRVGVRGIPASFKCAAKLQFPSGVAVWASLANAAEWHVGPSLSWQTFPDRVQSEGQAACAAARWSVGRRAGKDGHHDVPGNNTHIPLKQLLEGRCEDRFCHERWGAMSNVDGSPQ